MSAESNRDDAERLPLATEGGMCAALRRLFPAATHAVLFNVANATGSVSRRADAIVQSLWPSRGLWFAGVEIKVSRADWLRELKDGGKAEAIARFCNRWFLAVSDAGIVLPNELPDGWGLIAPERGALRIVTKSIDRTPEPWTPSFRAAILRAAQESVASEQALRTAREAGRAEGAASARERIDGETEHLRRELDRAKQAVAEIDRASGGSWLYTPAEFGAALKLQRALGGLPRTRAVLEHAAKTADDAARAIREAMTAADDAQKARLGDEEPE